MNFVPRQTLPQSFHSDSVDGGTCSLNIFSCMKHIHYIYHVCIFFQQCTQHKQSFHVVSLITLQMSIFVERYQLSKHCFQARSVSLTDSVTADDLRYIP